MIKKILKRVALLATIGLIVFFFLAGKIADRLYNKVDELEDYQISSRAKNLHTQLSIVDLHADNLLWDRDPSSELSHGHVDLQRLKKGNFTLQVFDAVIQTPKDLNYQSNTGDTDNIRTVAMANRWPVNTWFNLTNRAIHQSRVLHKAAESDGGLHIIRSSSDLDYFMKLRRSNSYLVGGILSIEGLHALDNDINNLDKLYEHGYRMMGLVHFFDNEVGGSSAGVNQGGLTDLGEQVIRKMNNMNLIIDLAHASEQLIDEVLQTSTKPVIVSHTGVKGVYDSPRNLSDRHIRAIAEKGGILGIGFWAEAAGSIHPSDIARSIRHVADLVGVEHVALGSDFDGAVETSFDSSQIIYITEALIREGFEDDEIKKIMGGNALQFFKENLPRS
jgi:membrane dipeptidase